MTYCRNENVTKIDDANDTKIKKKRPKLSFFPCSFTDFLKKKITSKCAGNIVSCALREMPFLVREQKTESCLFAQNHEFWSHCVLVLKEFIGEIFLGFFLIFVVFFNQM